MLILRAAKFATQAHGPQVRKYTGEPYVCHCLDVANVVAPYATPEMIAAALLHDTIEDTDVTREDIDREFGSVVAALVWDLTDQCHDGNRATRKAAEAQRLGKISPDAQTIKLADFISNTASIVEHDPGFAKIYLREKLRILSVMTAGNVELYSRAIAQIEEAKKSIGFKP